MHKVLVNRLEGPSLFTKSLVRLNDPPDMTLAVYHGCKTTRTTINIGTDKSEQIVQTQIRLLHQEQSDLGLHCLPFHLGALDA